jgi:drug/metabolite transporter (DMT)-like permease
MNPGVLTCAPATTLRDVARMMSMHRIHAVVVLGNDSGLRPWGVVSDLDLVGAWLIGVQRPLHPTVHGLKPTLYALGAAVLWALGTVLGRYLARDMRFEHVTTLRFTFGLPASAIALLVLGTPAFAPAHDMFWIAVLALVTGLVALGLYYYGLRRIPAVAATIAELAFPVSAILVGYFKFGQALSGWQWVGVVLTSLVVVLLPARPVERVDLVPAAAPA